MTIDLTIVGAGPVGLLCAYLAHRCGLRVVVLDRSTGPLRVGRADALNARSLQLLQLAGLFDDLYPLGKPCNTSSVWENGQFVSRQSEWWDAIEGCFHKHFLMLGQAHLEGLLDERCRSVGVDLRRNTEVVDLKCLEDGCVTTLADGTSLVSSYLIGADGGRSFVRGCFGIPFEIVRPQMTWAVLDAVIETDFPKVPEIIVFQADTADVAWIPRENPLDRFYIRMDRQDFSVDDAVAKINHAMTPHCIRVKETVWFSQFSVKESVAEHFSVNARVFLAGDACHIHSVNGGQGLNTGLGDAFNLIWKLHMVVNHGASSRLLDSYESERKPVALGVVETSGALVRATRSSPDGTHGQDYVKLVAQHAGNVTGMGIRYGQTGLRGTRLFDREVVHNGTRQRLYTLLDASRFSLLVTGDRQHALDTPPWVKVIRCQRDPANLLSGDDGLILVRPDAYIQWVMPLEAEDINWQDCFC